MEYEPYTYREATIFAAHVPQDEPDICEYQALIEHPRIGSLGSVCAGSLEELQQVAETAIDELIESWN